MIIKAGTYRFNKEISLSSLPKREIIDFIYDNRTYFGFEKLDFGQTSQALSYIYEVIDDTTTRTSIVYMNNSDLESFAWVNGQMHIVTIPYDQDTSDEFGVWFAETTVRVRKISGIWQMNETLIFPNNNIEENISFSVPVSESDVGLSYTAYIDCIYIDTASKSILGRTAYTEPEIDSIGVTIGYSNGKWKYDLWGPDIRLWDFGTEDQYITEILYNILKVNTIPAAFSIKEKIKRLIAKANSTTDKNDTHLTSGVNSLIEKIGALEASNAELREQNGAIDETLSSLVNVSEEGA